MVCWTEEDQSGYEEFKASIRAGSVSEVARHLSGSILGKQGRAGALFLAIEAGNPEVLAVVVAHTKPDLNLLDGWRTPLGQAMEHSDSASIVTKLCQLGADPNNPTNCEGWTPLQCAIGREAGDGDCGGFEDGCEPMFTRVLLEAGADPLLEDAKGSNALDWARSCRHRNAFDLMEAAVIGRQRSGADAPVSGQEGAARFPWDESTVVTIGSCLPTEDRESLVLAADDNGQLILRSPRNTTDEGWRFVPNRVPGVEREGFFLVHWATGRAVIQPNPGVDFLYGDAPILQLGIGEDIEGDKGYLWTLRPVGGGAEGQLWAIQDFRHAYGFFAERPNVNRPSRVKSWAWTGEEYEKWRIRPADPLALQEVSRVKEYSSRKSGWRLTLENLFGKKT